MTDLFQPAVKEALHARVAIDGPTGAGKTWTALQWARILAGPDGRVGVVDTENRSAAYYAPTPGRTPDRLNYWSPPYDFGHKPWPKPYDPRTLVHFVDACADRLDVLVIDSLTHFWSGEGGTLDVVDNAAQKSGGNNFAGWKEGSPAQRNLVDTLVAAPFHVIVTMRSKMEWLLKEEAGKNGKTVLKPSKVGMAPEQRAGIEYEFTVVADMDLEHRLAVTKSRCDLIADVVAPSGRSHEPAVTFRDWLSSGVQRIPVAAVDALRDRLNAADATIRKAFRETWGNPAELTTDQLDLVVAWLDATPTTPPTPAAPTVILDTDEALRIFHEAADAIESATQ